MKKLTFILCLLVLSLGTHAATKVNEEVLKIFSKNISGGTKHCLGRIEGDYKVFFTKNNVSYRLRYDVDGNVTLCVAINQL